MAPKNIKRRTTKFAKYLFISVSAFIVLLVVGMAVLRLYYNDSRLQDVLTETAQDYLNAKFSIGELNMSILSSILIRDFYIVEKADTIFGCRELSLDYSARKLMAGKLEITGMQLIDPVANLRFDPDGELDLSWLKTLEDSLPAEDSMLEEVEADTASSELPVEIKLDRFVIKNLKARTTGPQRIYVDGLNLTVNELYVPTLDSIYGHVELTVEKSNRINILYGYADTAGFMEYKAPAELRLEAELSPGPSASGELSLSCGPLYATIDSLELVSSAYLSTPVSYDGINSELDIPGIEIDIGRYNRLRGAFKMGFAEGDSILPMEIAVDRLNLDLREISGILDDMFAGIEIEGKVNSNSFSMVSNERYPGMKMSGDISLNDVRLSIPEQGISVGEINVSSGFDGIMSGDRAGYVIDINGEVDSINYALDDTTDIFAPGITLAAGGSLDSLFMPDSLSAELSVDDLWGKGMKCDVQINGGIPPEGAMSLSISMLNIDIEQLPYSEYRGYGVMSINVATRGVSWSANSSFSANEIFITLEEDSLFIPELPVSLRLAGRMNSGYTYFSIDDMFMGSPELFDATGGAVIAMEPEMSVKASLEANIYHDYLQDFIPSAMRDSLGEVELDGQSSVRCSVEVETGKDEEMVISANGDAESSIDTLSVELYAFSSSGIRTNAKFNYFNDILRARGDLNMNRFTVDDSLMVPMADIEGKYTVTYQDSLLSWSGVDVDVKSHSMQLSSRGSFEMGEAFKMDLYTHLSLYTQDDLPVYDTAVIKGRIEGWCDLRMDDSTMFMRGSINPFGLSVEYPEVASISSISGRMPFEQKISMENLRLVSERRFKERLNILDFEQAKFYGTEEDLGILSFQKLETGRVFIENFSLETEINNGRIVARRLYTDVYGGNLIGDFYIDLSGIDFAEEVMKLDSLKYSANLQMSAVNFDKLVGSKDVSSRADISGDLSLTGRGLVSPEEDFELEGQVNITKIGPRATKRLLDFLDPTGTDISIAETRKLMDRKFLFLDISYQPKSLSMKIKHGNVNPSIDMDQPFFAKYLRIGAVTMPVEYDRKQLQALMKAAAATPVEE
ncbi:MAG: hypothetical protein GF307_06985 [candidate division Zixibacteria bacterium]|nr:hypothetical protein [candidate division Zixibacteria bacterium]